MVGQDSLVRDIRNKFGKGSVPLVILLTGGYGSGKTSLAQILGMSFNCTHQKQFGEPCDVCLENEEMFHIIEHSHRRLSADGSPPPQFNLSFAAAINYVDVDQLIGELDSQPNMRTSPRCDESRQD